MISLNDYMSKNNQIKLKRGGKLMPDMALFIFNMNIFYNLTSHVTFKSK